jgi:hypothetical protein
MWISRLTTGTAVLTAMVAVTVGELLAQQPLAPKSAIPVAVAEAKAKPADSAEMAETEAKLAKLREFIRPQPGEHVTNIAKIAWERDPWVAAVKAGKEGKPVLVYAEGAAGIACGYG